MHTFNPVRNPVMAEGYEDYLEPVKALCQAAEALTNNPIHEAHMTVDEKVVQPGMSQRRPGAHVDGCFMPALQSMGSPPTQTLHGPTTATTCPYPACLSSLPPAYPGVSSTTGSSRASRHPMETWNISAASLALDTCSRRTAATSCRRIASMKAWSSSRPPNEPSYASPFKTETDVRLLDVHRH